MSYAGKKKIEKKLEHCHDFVWVKYLNSFGCIHQVYTYIDELYQASEEVDLDNEDFSVRRLADSIPPIAHSSVGYTRMEWLSIFGHLSSV